MTYERRSVDLSGYPDLCVIYLGYRVRGFSGLGRMLHIGRGLQAVRRNPPDGLLAHEPLLFGWLHVGFRQYWRDFDSLERFTKAATHAGWWRDFARNSAGGGIWHETYRLRGGMEAIYSGMPVIGLASFAPARSPTGPRMSARARIEA